jgi:hypothetical protein
MHDIILPCENGFVPDHKNGYESRVDNRKSNLRKVTNQQNTFNKDKSIRNTSGFVGVSFKKDRNKYDASIGLNYKIMHLGIFNTFTEAVKKRIEDEIEYYGEYMYKPHLKVLKYINDGNELIYGDKETIDKIMEGDY